MKAAIYERYGPPEVVTLRDVPTPAPRDHEIRIRVRATTVSTGDWRVRSLRLPPGFGPLGRLAFGITRPRQPILGTELSGVVEQAGREVRAFAAGDEVFAFADAAMGVTPSTVASPRTASWPRSRPTSRSRRPPRSRSAG